MNRKRFYILSFVCLIAIAGQAQQLPVFTNYLLNSYAYNPAVAGSTPNASINLNYRNQWVGFNDAPKTYLASAYGGVGKQRKVALGGLVASDNTGLLSRTSGYVTFAYHVNLNKNYKLGFGISAGMIQYRIRLYDAKVADKGDDLLSGNILSNNVFDSNAGLYFYSKKLFVGISGSQYLANKITWVNSQSHLSPHFYGMAGYTFDINKNFSLQPSVLIKYNQPTPVQPEYSLRAYYKNAIWVGASYRTKDAVSALVGFTLREKLRVGYSYDFPVTKLRSYNSGSHEIMLMYNFTKPKKKLNSDEIEFNDIDNSIKNKLKKQNEEGAK